MYYWNNRKLQSASSSPHHSTMTSFHFVLFSLSHSLRPLISVINTYRQTIVLELKHAFELFRFFDYFLSHILSLAQLCITIWFHNVTFYCFWLAMDCAFHIYRLTWIVKKCERNAKSKWQQITNSNALRFDKSIGSCHWKSSGESFVFSGCSSVVGFQHNNRSKSLCNYAELCENRQENDNTNI